MQHLFSKKYLLNKLFVVFLALFLLISLLGKNSNLLTLFVGLPLIFFYPGYYVSRFWKPTLPAASRLSLSVVFSFAIQIVLLTLLRSAIPLEAGRLSAYLLLTNITIAACYFGLFFSKQKADTLPYNWQDYVIAGIPILFFFINFAISPVVSEGDSYYFIYAAISSFAAGHDISPYINRPGFIPFLGLLHLAGGEGWVFIFRILLSMLFYISILMCFDFFRRYSKNYSFTRWLFLLFLAAPVIPAEVDIARTQSLVLALTIPVLLLLCDFLAEKQLDSLIVATLLAAIGTRIHELSYVLLLTCFVTGGIYALRYLYQMPNRKKAGLLLLQIIGAGLIVLYPYYKLLTNDPSFTFISNSSHAIFDLFLHPHWTWWFLSNYTSDGSPVGWQGIQALYYYLYNGLIFALAGIGLMIFLRKHVRWSLIFPPLFLAGIYFFIAEILPRMGLFYYPNRAWPHMMLGLVLVAIFLMLDVKLRWGTWSKPIIIIGLILTVTSGVIGWTDQNYDKGGFYTVQETNVRNFIQNRLPADAVIYTPQSPNQAIIQVYGNKQTQVIASTTTFSTPSSLIPDTLKQITVSAEDTSTTVPYKEETFVESKSGDILSSTVSILPPSGLIATPVQPVATLQKDAYFYYSFARFDGTMGQRDWWRAVNSYQNYAFFENYPNTNVVYRDASGIIIKLN